MDDFISTANAAKMLNWPKTKVEKKIAEGVIEVVGGQIPMDCIRKLLDEQKQYISLLEYANNHTETRFSGQIVHDREILLEYIEENCDVEMLDYECLAIGTDRDMVFFRRSEVAELDKKLNAFFCEFGLTEKEKTNLLLSNTKRKNTKYYIQEYICDNFSERDMTGVFTEFVRVILEFPDVTALTDADSKKICKKLKLEGSKEHCIRFLNYVREHEKVSFGKVQRTQKESNPVPAYSNDTYLQLVPIVFDSKYIYEHQMIEKAISNHFYAEMWLYIALFFTCGWRAADICDAWVYPKLGERGGDTFGINLETLEEDILTDRISQEVYKKICVFCLRSVEVSERLPSKNKQSEPNPLLAVITEELYSFFGLLLLIAEANKLKNGEGYMRKNRYSQYQNKMNLADFFGKEIGEVLHGNNLESKRLNKVFLQGIENTGRKDGYGGILTAAVASFARNHSDLNTIKHYLKDGKWTGDDAGTVMYFIYQRGVLGFEIYNTLLTAFPDALKELTTKEVSEIIGEMNISPIEIEKQQSMLLAEKTIKEYFEETDKYDEQMALRMLNSMYALSQMRGSGKDTGVYCKKRISGKACSKPEYESCLANCCDELILTKLGILPLIEVLAKYQKEAENGNKKAATVLRQVMIPRFQSIINQFIRENELDKEEKIAIRKLIKEGLNERNKYTS